MNIEENTKNLTYFQYFKDEDYPVYLSVDLEEFTPEIFEFLQSVGFSEISPAEGEKIAGDIEKNTAPENTRMLCVTRASTVVARQIEILRPNDRFGQESLVAKSGYKVYRYRGTAMMVTSLAVNKWELGCYEDFGKVENETDSDEAMTPFRVVVNRFLSWAMAPLGVVGFWGVPVSEGCVISKQKYSKGEAVFFDVFKNRFLSIEGARSFTGRFQIMRLDSTLHGRNIVMREDELRSFLTEHCTFFSESGLTVPVRQMIQVISKNCLGVVHPKESFKPRTSEAA